MGLRSILACPWVSRRWEEWEITLPRAVKAEFAEGSAEEDNGFLKVISTNRGKSINWTNRVEMQVPHDCTARPSSAAAIPWVPKGTERLNPQPQAPPCTGSASWGAAGPLHFAGTVVLETLGISGSGLAGFARSSSPLARPEAGLLQQRPALCSAALRYSSFSLFRGIPAPHEPGHWSSGCRGHRAEHWCAAGASRQPDLSLVNWQAEGAGTGAKCHWRDYSSPDLGHWDASVINGLFMNGNPNHSG